MKFEIYIFCEIGSDIFVFLVFIFEFLIVDFSLVLENDDEDLVCLLFFIFNIYVIIYKVGRLYIYF